MPDYYDPVAHLAAELSAALVLKKELCKNPAVYFDGHTFIVNIASAAGITEQEACGIVENIGGLSSVSIKKEDFFHFYISKNWIETAAGAFPAYAAGNLNMPEHALITRMQAHIGFGFCGDWTDESYAVALLLFKIINTKSARIRCRTGTEFRELVERHLRSAFMPPALLQAIINAINMLNYYNRGFL